MKRRIYRVFFGVCCVILGSVFINYNKREAAPTLEIKQEMDVEKKPIVVESILQNPELPTGCEATAVTMLLRAYGYKVDKTMVADRLSKGEPVEYAGKVYASHPDEKFIGNPYLQSGYGAFPGVLKKAAQDIIDKMEGNHVVNALYGLTEQEVLKKIDEGIPLCVWTSMDDKEIEYRKGWYLIQDRTYTNEYFEWPANEHVVVLTDYNDECVTVCDPLKGVCQYSRESFFRHYRQVGMYALEIREKGN